MGPKFTSPVKLHNKVVNTSELLGEKGFLQGKSVVCKDVEGTWVIESLSDKVHLKNGELDLHIDVQKFSMQVQKREWKIAKDKSIAVPLQSWRENANPLESVDIKQKFEESIMLLALHAAHKRFADCLAGVDPLVNDDGKLQGVQTNRSFPPNSLVLVPLSDSMSFRSGKDAGSGVRTETTVKNPRDDAAPAARLWIMKKEVMPVASDAVHRDKGFVEKKNLPAFIAPYWLVGNETNGKLVNMVVKTKVIKVVVDGTDHNVTVPVLQNPRAIKEDTKLRKLKPVDAADASGSKRKAEDESAQAKRGRGRGK